MNRIVPVLGVPYYNRPDLLDRMVRSIDFGVDRLVIVDNSPMGMPPFTMAAHGAIESWVNEKHVIRHPNAGVAGSWNEIIKLFPAPWWMLVNNDIQFSPGDLQKMAEAAHKRGALVASFFGNHGHSFFIVTRLGIERVGLFDENIYPAYLEDCDWMRRLKLTDEIYIDVEGVSAVHGDKTLTGSCTIQSDERLRELNGRTHGGNFQYYRQKWGGNNGEETFKTPFNDPHWPLWAWEFDPHRRERQQWR